MKRLYAHLVLWLIRPALSLEEEIRLANVKPIPRSVLEDLARDREALLSQLRGSPGRE